MSTVFLKLKSPHTGTVFVGNLAINNKQWHSVETSGLGSHLRASIIESLNQGVIKGDQPMEEILLLINEPMTVRDIEKATSLISGNCCCMSSMMIPEPVPLSHLDGTIGVPLTFVLEYKPFTSTDLIEDDHTASNWEVYSDPDYTAIVFSSYDDEDNLTSIPVTVPDNHTAYYPRVQFISEEYRSKWSKTIRIFTEQA